MYTRRARYRWWKARRDARKGVSNYLHGTDLAVLLSPVTGEILI